MDRKLFIQAITKFIMGFIIISLFLFIPAGTLNYWNAWLFIFILFIPMFIVGIILMIKNPDLLRKRLNSKEKESKQEILIRVSLVMFISGFIVAGLNYRFKWLILPRWIIVISTIIFLFAYVLYAEVLRENAYLSRIIEIQENQKVIDTGLYKVVRYPMYLSTILLFLSMSLVLGSLFSFIIFLIYPVIVVKRIKNEEEVLERNLYGYLEYKSNIHNLIYKDANFENVQFKKVFFISTNIKNAKNLNLDEGCVYINSYPNIELNTDILNAIDKLKNCSEIYN